MAFNIFLTDKKETELLGCNPIYECTKFTNVLKLKWSRAILSTAKEFEIVIQKIDYSQYFHL